MEKILKEVKTLKYDIRDLSLLGITQWKIYYEIVSLNELELIKGLKDMVRYERIVEEMRILKNKYPYIGA